MRRGKKKVSSSSLAGVSAGSATRVSGREQQKSKQCPTFRFRQALPQGLTPEQAREQALDAVAGLAERPK